MSVNFWFAATNRLLTPTSPLVPSMRVELARQVAAPLHPGPGTLHPRTQLEYFISDCLQDAARHVPAFFAALQSALHAAQGTAAQGTAGGDALQAAFAASHAVRPEGA